LFENGLGMVSSPSFRGPHCKAVIWNGININSQLLGQTDFNTITTQDFNSIRSLLEEEAPFMGQVL
jgi:iron complex outermembrane receptor protein